MMREMDGHEALTKAQELRQLTKLPPTARAMHGDGEKSIASETSGYATIPVDTGQQRSLLRSWLHR